MTASRALIRLVEVELEAALRSLERGKGTAYANVAIASGLLEYVGKRLYSVSAESTGVWTQRRLEGFRLGEQFAEAFTQSDPAEVWVGLFHLDPRLKSHPPPLMPPQRTMMVAAMEGGPLINVSKLQFRGAGSRVEVNYIGMFGGEAMLDLIDVTRLPQPYVLATGIDVVIIPGGLAQRNAGGAP